MHNYPKTKILWLFDGFAYDATHRLNYCRQRPYLNTGYFIRNIVTQISGQNHWR